MSFATQNMNNYAFFTRISANGRLKGFSPLPIFPGVNFNNILRLPFVQILLRQKITKP